MTEEIRIRANTIKGYLEAIPGQCIWLTFPGTRHTSVIEYGLCGTITTRPGELGVYIGGVADE